MAKWSSAEWGSDPIETSEGNTMKQQLVKAARMHAEGELERAKTNVMVYMNQSVGIGEHSDIVEAIQEELDKMAASCDRMEMLERFFME
tara:strand:+ start:712 stop:978 length:267 start_codon:yes stop_codon:yes gene_type:complete